MRFLRLTLWGAFARLQNESAGIAQWKTPAPGQGRGPIRWRARLAVCAAVGLGLAGCAGIRVDSSPEAKQQFVGERALARWQVLMKGDVDGAYQFFSAGSKVATSPEVYKSKMRPGMWRAAKVDKVDCQGEICKVTMLITYDTRPMRGIQTPVEETWIIENGSAWYVYR